MEGRAASHVLEQVKLKPEARYLVFHCADTLYGEALYYESIGLEDALHAQTILAYEMNDETLDRPARRAAPRARRAAARLQDGEIHHAHRGGGKSSPISTAARAASGKTAATSGTAGFEAAQKLQRRAFATRKSRNTVTRAESLSSAG